MNDHEVPERDVTRLSVFASRMFFRIETVVYIVLGLFLALTALLGIGNSGVFLWNAIINHAAENLLVLTIDRLLFVLMVIEILHTVRVSFRSGTLVAEPFLVVGLIASIRRVLVITLESSQVSQPDKWSANSQGYFDSTMMELGVLGGLIVVMVVSIYLLRHSKRMIPE